MAEPKSTILTRVLDGFSTYERGWTATAVVGGSFAGPATAALEYAVWSVNASSLIPRLMLGSVAAFVLVMCFVALRSKGVRARGWSRGASACRAAVTLAVGGVIWALPGGWSVPTSVFGAPFDWLLFTVPYGLAAVAVSPLASLGKRVLVVAPLVMAALAWPTICGLAATEARRQSGAGAEQWFVADVPGHSPSSVDVQAGGFTEVDYRARGEDDEDFDDLVLTSWPATTDSPCDGAKHVTGCSFVDDGNFWTGESDDGYPGSDLVIATRHGSRWVAATIQMGTARLPVPPQTIPGIVAGAHVAGDHEFLAAVNGF